MPKINMPIIEVTIRRDANTITPTTVAKHETWLLNKIFGAENVKVGDVATTREMDTEGEYERLSAKYGREIVVAVFGDDGGLRLAEVMEREAGEVGRKAKKADKQADNTSE